MENNSNPDLSIVISLFNEEESLPELVQWIDSSLTPKGFSFEIIMVDDGSTDGSWRVINELKVQYDMIRAIRFRRNYGKSAALYCGFEAACGEIVVTMDADLQDNPEEIPEMVRMIREDGYDLVSGWKKKRYDNVATKNLPSKLYNATARKVTGIKLHDMNCGLKAYRKEVVKHIEVYGEMHRFIPYLAKNAGFGNIGEKVVLHQARKYGKSKFGLDRFIHGFLDLLSIWFLQKFGKKPMYLFGGGGTLMFLTGIVITIWLIAKKLVAQANGHIFRAVTDQPLFYLALLAVILGVQLFLTGFLAELVSRNSQDRNKYNIRERI
ncbi:MAG: glycosyltransferase family 2 protein [Bacteroidales bacterium]|nr:glycosyltransferase family 2 protein [Candidatus Cacconaster equifaecalis]